METLVLPPQDQLAQRHYWHNTVMKMGGFLPPMLTPPRSRRRSTASASLYSKGSLLDSDRDGVPFSDGSHGLLPLPLFNSPLESFVNTTGNLHNLPFPLVASSIPRSAGYLSSSLQPHHIDLHFGDPAVNTRFLSRSENEPMHRPASSSGRYFNQLKQGRNERFEDANVENAYIGKGFVERASSFSKPRSGLRTARSLPEQAVMKLARGKALANDTILKPKKPSNAPSVEAPEKKGYKDKKTTKKNGADKAFLETNSFQRKALENSPVQVTILQRPETKEAALHNLARFNGDPLTELCSKNGLLLPAKSENGSRKTCPESDLATVKGNEALGISNLKGGNYSVVATPKFPNRLSRRHSSFEKVSGVLEAMKDTEPSCFHKVQESSLTGDVTPVKALNESVQLSSEEISPVEVPEFSSDLSKSVWAAEILAEKWAGPCYTASPPPSSLPIPKFHLQRQPSSTLDVGASDQCEELTLKYASASLSKEGVPIVAGHSFEDVKHVEMDTEMATKDLRRILHLDFL